MAGHSGSGTSWGTITGFLGTTISAYGSIKAGQEKKEDLFRQARFLIRNANVTRAAAQRDANDERKLAEFAVSEAIANAAASGGGVSNPTVLNLIAQLETEGEYRALSRMFAGAESAKSMEIEARIARKKGRAAKRSGVLDAVTTIFGS